MATDANSPTLDGQLLPLSLSQREVWLDQRAWSGSCHLNIGGCGLLYGRLDLALYRRALCLLVEETEAMRLVPQNNGQQILLGRYVPELPLVELGDVGDPVAAMRQYWQQKIAEPFADDGRPPWRFILLRSSDLLHGITIQFHHLLMDGWGTTQVARRWSEIYNALAAGESPVPNLARPYSAFIQDSLAYQAAPAFARDGEFWLGRLPAVPPPLFERRGRFPAGELPAAHLLTQRIQRADYQRLQDFSAAQGTTPFTVLLAALAIYFARTRGRAQVVIGIPSLNRGGKRYLATPGMFVGVLPLAIAIDQACLVGDQLASLNAVIRDALRHPSYPLSELSRQLQVFRSGSDGLFDVLLSFERQDYAIRFGEAELIDSRQLFTGIARYPLGVTFCEFHPEQDLELVLEGSSACFQAPEVAALACRLWHLVEAMIDGVDRPVSELPLLPVEESKDLVASLHRDVIRHEAPKPFVQQFAEQAARLPDATAVIWDGGALTYGELAQRAWSLAKQLLAVGVGPGSIVALAVERGPDMVVAMLAIARARAAFLPLDVDAPLARLQQILTDSKAVALLIQGANQRRLGALHANTLVIDQLPMVFEVGGDEPMPDANDLCYVLYTSGSTGQPKGVMVEHGALARRLAWLTRNYGITPDDRSGQATQYTFDPALIELCLPLINGASVALPPPGRLAPETLVDFAIAQQVTFIAFVPSTLQRFLDALAGKTGACLRVACTGGEVLTKELADRFRRTTGGRLFNVYGPTEATIFATACLCSEGEPTIGRPVDDSRIYILDERRQLLPPGEKGEIYIGGEALARGYLGQPELDREAFFSDPFVPGGRIYRSGDLGWLDSDGQLHFVGRCDRQIKLRGYRIEPGEIEAALHALAGVQRAAVRLYDGEHGPSLQAWVATSGSTDSALLLQGLRERLPDYMLPAGISCLPTLPETSSGKIDYDALPAPLTASVRVALRQPASQMEWALLGLWERILEKTELGIGDDFFAVGGDSLAAIDILAAIEKMLGRRISLHVLTENPTIESLARALVTTENSGQPMLPLGGDKQHPPLYLAASGHGDLWRFQALTAALAGEFAIYMLQPPESETPLSMGDLAAVYAEQIAATGTAGYLAGFSVGGIAALETARCLRERGLVPRGLVLIDTVYPSALVRACQLWRLSGWLTRKLHIQELSMNGRRLGAMFNDPGLTAQIMALGDYQPRPYDGPVLLIKSSGLINWERWLFRPWRRQLTDGLSETEIPGLHGSLFEPENIGGLAASLAALDAWFDLA